MDELFRKTDEAYAFFTGAELEAAIAGIVKESRMRFGDVSLQYASMLSELGGFYRGQRRLSESAGCFSKASALLLELRGADSPDYATSLNNLAGTYRLAGKFDEAEKLFGQALEIYERSTGRDSMLFASGLNNLSLICLDRGESGKALSLQEQALGILRSLPECRDELASALCNTAAVRLNLGNFADAAALFSDAIAMFETELGTDTPHYHAAFNGLGIARLRTGDIPASVEAFERAYAAAVSLYGEKHPESEAILSSLNYVRSL